MIQGKNQLNLLLGDETPIDKSLPSIVPLISPQGEQLFQTPQTLDATLYRYVIKVKLCY